MIWNSCETFSTENVTEQILQASPES